MQTKQMVKVYKALSNENRLAIYRDILEFDKKKYPGSKCLVSRIAETLRIGAPTISHHLKELSNAGLIETRKEGKFLVASVNKALLNDLKEEFEI